MGHRNREIEKKFVVSKSSMSYEDTIKAIKPLLNNITKTIEDGSKDFYWKIQRPLKGDFIRLRYMPDGTGQLTVKEADRGSNLNRIEIDVDVDDAEQCYKYQAHIHGEEAGSVFKNYFVMFLDHDEHQTVSIYRVRGDSRVFVEIEAKTQAKVEELTKLIIKDVGLTYETRSLCQIFIEGKK